MGSSEDDEYSDDDDFVVPDKAGNTDGYTNRSSKAGPSQKKQAPGRSKERWEDIQRSWDLVTEGADGSLANTVEGLAEASKRRRLQKDTTPLQRGIIRHVVLIIDLSSAMLEKDLRPTRYHLALRTASEFITSFFEENPISQLAILGTRDGLSVRISEMSGNPSDHILALQTISSQDPSGSPSLQNALEMARANLIHAPTHGTREVILIYGALLTSDPGDIHATIGTLAAARIRVSVVGLAARMAICTELVSRTNGLPRSADAATYAFYGVALHEAHFRDLFLAHTTPPASRAHEAAAPSLLRMGFPSRVEEREPSLCACHARPGRVGYLCPRCGAKVCALPSQCPTCEMRLVQSTHLARSYHHLFPLPNWTEVSWVAARERRSRACFGCLRDFVIVPSEEALRSGGVSRGVAGASESGRYACPQCAEHFCIQCDVFAHETLHNCAGCLSRPTQEVAGEQMVLDGGSGVGGGHAVALVDAVA